MNKQTDFKQLPAAIAAQIATHVGRDGEALEFCYCCEDYIYPDDMNVANWSDAQNEAMAKEFGGACCAECTDETIADWEA